MRRHKWSSSTEVARLVRRCLDQGNSVEIDGIGIFRPDGKGGFDFVAETRLQVFVAYVVEDLPKVERLSAGLEQHGIEPWTDRRKLLPGQNWPRAIERAIDMSHFFVACLSANSVGKRGRFQAEMRYAMDCAALVPQEEAFLIPVRFDDCVVPAAISRSIHYVDMFPDWDAGLRRIVASTKRR